MVISAETADAYKAIAETAGKAIDLVSGAGSFIKPFGGIVEDWGNTLRYANQCRLADKIQALDARRRAAGKPPLVAIKPAFILPVLEAASLECDDEVQDLWAALLVNAGDPDKGLVLKKVYIDILRGLQPLDVHVLRALKARVPDTLSQTDPMYKNMNTERLAESIAAPVDDVQVSLQTLARHCCVLDSWPLTFADLDAASAGFRVNNPRSDFALSDLGRRLLAATHAD